MKRRGRRPLLILLAAVLVIAITLSIGTLERLRFDAGSSQGEDGVGGPRRGAVEISASRWMAVRTVVFLFTSFALLVLAIAACFGRAYRRLLLWTAIGLLLTIGVVTLLQSLDAGRTAPASSDPVSGGSSTPTTESTRRPWVPLAAALLIAVTAVLAGTLAVRSGIRAVRRFRQARRTERILDTVSDAVDRLRSGDDADVVVLRCYREMLAITCEATRIKHDALTPREFEAELHDVGLSTESVHRLTELFELVRYGHRDGPPLADRATAALEAVRQVLLSPHMSA